MRDVDGSAFRIWSARDPIEKMGMRASLATQKPFSQKILEFHNLNVWDSGYGYDRVRMNQSIIDGRIHYLSTNKI